MAETGDYLCRECRDRVDNVVYCAHSKCEARFSNDGEEYCPECRVKSICEYCGALYNVKFVNVQRFAGLCHVCRVIASNSVPRLSPERPVMYCSDCESPTKLAYSECCDREVRIEFGISDII